MTEIILLKISTTAIVSFNTDISDTEVLIVCHRGDPWTDYQSYIIIGHRGDPWTGYQSCLIIGHRGDPWTGYQSYMIQGIVA